MNSLVGKSTGIALLMAAALLAALFAMGVFSAGSVGAHQGTAPHEEVDLHLVSTTITVTGGTDIDIVDDTYSYSTNVNRTATMVNFDIDVPTNLVITSSDVVDADPLTTNVFDVEIDLTDSIVGQVQFTVQDDPAAVSGAVLRLPKMVTRILIPSR